VRRINNKNEEQVLRGRGGKRDRKACKRWEMCMVCGAGVCCEVGWVDGERKKLGKQKSLTSLGWLKTGQASLELLTLMMKS